MKNESRQCQDHIKQNLQDNTTHAAAVFDMQEVLYSPNSDESSLYYKRKVNSYNLTVYDYRNKHGYCNIWPETEGMGGSNEVGSYVYRYLENLQKEGIKKVTLFSDSCGGQNRNKNFLSMLWYARHKYDFDEIEHVFFVSGHSQNEGACIRSLKRLQKTFPSRFLDNGHR